VNKEFGETNTSREGTERGKANKNKMKVGEIFNNGYFVIKLTDINCKAVESARSNLEFN
jgi:hypothetical protein